MSAVASTSLIRGRLPPLRLLIAVLGAALALAVAYFAPNYWSMSLAQDAFCWAVAVFAVAIFLRIAFGERAGAALLGVAALYFIVGVGLVEAATVALFLVSARCLGAAALAFAGAKAKVEFEFSRPFAVGLALYLALFGALIHTSGNSQGLYFAILIAPLVVALAIPRVRQSLGSFREAIADAEAVLARLPFWRLAATVAFVGFVARYAFFPSVCADDDVLHLRLWTELTFQGGAAFSIADDVWAVAPFAFDLVHAAISLTAGSDARGALDLAVFVLVLLEIWALAAVLRIDESDRLIVVALFASTPLVAWLLTTLQTELFLALLGVLGVRFLVDTKKGFEIGDFLAVGAVAALCAATKLPAVVLGGSLFGVAVAKAFTGSGRAERAVALRRWPVVLAFAAFAFVAVHAYALALHLTYNPVFPLLNVLFRSRHFPLKNFTDPRWSHGFGLSSYLGLFFDTHRFQESRDYTAGFQYLFLLPLGIVAILRRLETFDATAILAPLLLFGVAMFSQTTYLRYLFPVAGLASVTIAALLSSRAGAARTLSRFAMCVCIALNLFFLPGESWIFVRAPSSVYSAAGRAQATSELSPGKALTLKLNGLGAPLRVLYPPDASAGAALLGEPLYVNWYAPARAIKYRAIKDEGDVAAFLRDERVDYALISPMTATARVDLLVGDSAATARVDLLVGDYLTRYGEPTFEDNPFTVVRVRDEPLAYRQLFVLGDQAPFQADETPRAIAYLATGNAAFGRYTVRFSCAGASGSFIAQINWDIGAPYYRLTNCVEGERTVVDVFTIPAGARGGTVFVTTRNAGGAKVSALRVETD